MEERSSPPQEVESVDANQDVPVGVDLEEVPVQRVKHQASEGHTHTATVTRGVVVLLSWESKGGDV